MKQVQFHISPLHAETMATHLLVLLNQSVTGQAAGSISAETMGLLQHCDAIYQRLLSLKDDPDDETPQPISLSLPEAEALIKAFTDDALIALASRDKFYKKHSYGEYFAQIYAAHLEALSAAYVDALAA